MTTGNEVYNAREAFQLPSGPGLYVYAGRTRTGKTTLAIAEAYAVSRETGWPICVLDFGRAENWKDWPRADSLEQVIHKLWPEQGGVRKNIVWTPKAHEVPAFFTALANVQKDPNNRARVVLVMDECGTQKVTPDMETVFRTWHHCQVSVHATSQHLSRDFGRVLISCGPKTRLFRIRSWTVLRLLREYTPIDTDRLSTLERGEFLVYEF